MTDRDGLTGMSMTAAPNRRRGVPVPALPQARSQRALAKSGLKCEVQELPDHRFRRRSAKSCNSGKALACSLGLCLVSQLLVHFEGCLQL